MRFHSKVRVLWRKEDGGVSLECALIMPLVMTMLLALFSCLKLLAAQMALQSAVSETVKLVSAHMYEIRAVAEIVQSERREAMSGSEEAVRQAASALEMLEPLLPDALRPVAEALLLLTGEGSRTPQPVVAASLLPLLKQQSASPWLKEDALRIVDVHVPLSASQSNHIALTAEYPVELPLPFYRKTWILRAGAYERGWLGQ